VRPKLPIKKGDLVRLLYQRVYFVDGRPSRTFPAGSIAKVVKIYRHWSEAEQCDYSDCDVMIDGIILGGTVSAVARLNALKLLAMTAKMAD
jgi:hypothetical protein